jgi:hypothetical protein
MKPLVAPRILDTQEAMLNHDEEYVLDHPKTIRLFDSLRDAAESKQTEVGDGCQESEV